MIDGHELDKLSEELDEVLSKYGLQIGCMSGVFSEDVELRLLIEKKEAENGNL